MLVQLREICVYCGVMAILIITSVTAEALGKDVPALPSATTSNLGPSILSASQRGDKGIVTVLTGLQIVETTCATIWWPLLISAVALGFKIFVDTIAQCAQMRAAIDGEKRRLEVELARITAQITAETKKGDAEIARAEFAAADERKKIEAEIERAKVRADAEARKLDAEAQRVGSGSALEERRLQTASELNGARQRQRLMASMAPLVADQAIRVAMIQRVVDSEIAPPANP